MTTAEAVAKAVEHYAKGEVGYEALAEAVVPYNEDPRAHTHVLALIADEIRDMPEPATLRSLQAPARPARTQREPEDMPLHECEYCGEIMQPRVYKNGPERRGQYELRRFCDRKCSKRAHAQRVKEKIAAMDKPPCPVCGKEVTWHGFKETVKDYARRKYCSAVCGRRNNAAIAKRKRHAAHAR